eukprot:gene6722-biopygen7088
MESANEFSIAEFAATKEPVNDMKHDVVFAIQLIQVDVLENYVSLSSDMSSAFTAHTTSFTQLGGGTVGAGLCADANNVANCGESNVDVQWITSVAPVAPLTYWYDTASDLVAWLTAVADLSNPPLVISISYATPESTVSSTFNQEFNVQALKLVAMGVTIVVASG